MSRWIPVTFFSKSIILLLYGNAFLQSSTVLIIHIWSSVFVALGVASSKWFILEGLFHIVFYRTLVAAILNLFFNFFLIPNFGIEGAAISSLISYSYFAVFSLLFYRKTRNIALMKFRGMNLFRLVESFRSIKNILVKQ